MSSLLQKAITLAVKAHAEAEDPPGEPYILHPMRVLLAVSQGDDAHQMNDLRCVAILHDTLERTSLTEADLRRAKIPAKIVRVVKLLTHKKPQTYVDYIIKLKPNPLACAVKLADLADNADLRHLTLRENKSKDLRRPLRYGASYKYLTNQLSESAYRKLMKHAE